MQVKVSWMTNIELQKYGCIFIKGRKKKKIKSSYSEMEEDRENRVQEFQALVENELVGRCN